MVADAALVGSVLLVAVTVAVALAVVTCAGAVYTPPEVIEPAEAAHVTPALAESSVTTAVNVCVALLIMVIELTAPIATLIDDGAAEAELALPPQPTAEARASKPADIHTNRRKFGTKFPHL
jgi:hypothetical protein